MAKARVEVAWASEALRYGQQPGTVLSLPCAFSSLQPCQVPLGVIYVEMDFRILIHALWLSNYASPRYLPSGPRRLAREVALEKPHPPEPDGPKRRV
jgi:hypothetical protein